MARFRTYAQFIGLLLFSHSVGLLATPDSIKRDLRFSSPAPYQEVPNMVVFARKDDTFAAAVARFVCCRAEVRPEVATT